MAAAAAPRNFGGGIGLIVAVIVLIWLASGFYIVDASQRGVVLRFGKYVEATQAGPRWHLPFPIEICRGGEPEPGQNGGSRLPRQRQEQDAERIADADRRREHHRYPVRRAVFPERPCRLSVQ